MRGLGAKGAGGDRSVGGWGVERVVRRFVRRVRGGGREGGGGGGAGVVGGWAWGRGEGGRDACFGGIVGRPGLWLSDRKWAWHD